MIPAAVLDELARSLQGPSDRLRLASTPCALDGFDLVRAAGTWGPATYFSSPRVVIGGIGCAWQVEVEGAGRLEALSGAVAGLPTDLPIPVAFSFLDGLSAPEWEGFPAATARLPEAAVLVRDGRSALVAVLSPGREAGELLDRLGSLESPPPADSATSLVEIVREMPASVDWKATVAHLEAEIRAGRAEKVVLARAVAAAAPIPLRPFELLAHRSGEVGFVFGWQEGDAAFVGASPELLVSRRGKSVRCRPLAGSAPLGAEGAAALLADPVRRREHALVVEDLVTRLGPLVAGLETAADPSVVRAETVQHLATEVSASVAGDVSVLELAAAIHPTAAVAGVPALEALALIAELESFERGWYGGGIGWSSPSGEGEIALGLRCALVRGSRVCLFAGNGIVASSDPAVELAENRLKMEAVLGLVGAAPPPPTTRGRELPS